MFPTLAVADQMPKIKPLPFLPNQFPITASTAGQPVLCTNPLELVYMFSKTAACLIAEQMVLFTVYDPEGNVPRFAI